MKFNTMTYEKDERIGIITLNRPESFNAINSEFIRELNRLIDEIDEDDDVSAVIIKGNEKFFCAGADIKEAGGFRNFIEAQHFIIKVQALFTKVEDLGKVVIAAVGGLALGGGCELTLVCDIRIASENARFGQPEIKIGVLPGAGGTQRLPRLVGVGRAKELLYSGDPIDAGEAYRIGLVNKVVPANSLMDEAKNMALERSKRPAVALKMIKMSVNRGINMDLESALSYESRCSDILYNTEDQKEGMRAFVEKRPPVFKGR